MHPYKRVNCSKQRPSTPQPLLAAALHLFGDQPPALMRLISVAGARQEISLPIRLRINVADPSMRRVSGAMRCLLASDVCLAGPRRHTATLHQASFQRTAFGRLRHVSMSFRIMSVSGLLPCGQPPRRACATTRRE